MLATTTAEVFAYIADHLHVIGWPVLIGFAWKFRGNLDAFLHSWEAMDARAQTTADTTAVIKQSVDKMSTNHLKHIEMSLASMDVRHEKETELLTNIDKGIAILVDRSKS
jgi:hypothetical protein